jgi:hypothetical protein
MLAGLLLPWVSVGVGDGHPYSGVSLIACWVPTTLAAIPAIGLGIAWRYAGREQLSIYIAFAAAFLFLFMMVTLVAIESVSGVLPLSFLPSTMRRSSAMASGGIGLWASLCASAVVVIAATGAASRWLDLAWWRSPQASRKRMATASLLALTVLVAWLRYQAWVESSALGYDLSLSGQAAPWVGPASLFAVLILVVALVLAAFSRFAEAGLFAAGSGWLLTLVAAGAIIASDSLAKVRLGDLMGGGDPDHTLTFHVALAAWGTYLSGLLIAVVGAILVCWPHHSRGG